MNTLQLADYLVFLVYFFIVAGYGYSVYMRKKTKSISASHDYFLAEGSLTWWAIGTSLIASNISSEQFIAMSGNGFKMGLAIATYEWMAALTLIIVAVFFIPVYLKNKIYTMPQFLSRKIQWKCSDDYGCILVVALCNCEFNFYTLFGSFGHQRNFGN